jgi:lipopolysaccharide/colanic/teichoic acid biosynthesis glycosyltransferase
MSSFTEEKATQIASGISRSIVGHLPTEVNPGPYFVWKYWFERAVAAVILLPGSVIVAMLVLLVRWSSPGPGIYRQLRVGKNGRTFLMYKIRTMRHDAETASGPVWSQQGDPRVTKIGRVLRKLHLDEFPQLLNVLKGEMTLVGPRPERPEFTQRLALAIPNYLDRLTVLPGITGLAQINLPPDSDLESVRRKLAVDLQYIKEAGFFLDLRMILCTATRLLGVHGNTVMRMFRLRRAIPYVPAAISAVEPTANGALGTHDELEFAREFAPLDWEDPPEGELAAVRERARHDIDAHHATHGHAHGDGLTNRVVAVGQNGQAQEKRAENGVAAADRERVTAEITAAFEYN